MRFLYHRRHAGKENRAKNRKNGRDTADHGHWTRHELGNVKCCVEVSKIDRQDQKKADGRTQRGREGTILLGGRLQWAFRIPHVDDGRLNFLLRKFEVGIDQLIVSFRQVAGLLLDPLEGLLREIHQLDALGEISAVLAHDERFLIHIGDVTLHHIAVFKGECVSFSCLSDKPPGRGPDHHKHG